MPEKLQPLPIPNPIITIASAEIVPFAKTGGLADVVGALSQSLASAGIPVNMVMPAYRSVISKYLAKIEPFKEIQISSCGRLVSGQLYRQRIGPFLDVYFVRADEYFDRECLYGDESGDYPDNAERFAFFSRAVLHVAGTTHSKLIHLHDWQAAPAAAFLKLQPEKYPELSETRVIQTIHNLSYQGLFGTEHWPALDLDWRYFSPSQFEFWGKINYLKSGLVNADRLTTVSPTYASEIQQNGCGFGLEGLLKERSDCLSGVLNGIDYNAWNPEADSYIKERFSVTNISGKALCKRFLQESYGLKVDATIPLACLVTRLVGGKGLGLVIANAQKLVKKEIQLIMLGKGENRYETFFNDLASRNPGKVGTKIAFDEAAAHQLIAGADILLMPSEREPCGLTQMYAERYGTIPIARRTGGLADSIEPYEEASGRGTGFVFDEFSGKALEDSIDQALSIYHQKTEWDGLLQRAMAVDHSWDRSMRQYLVLYRDVLQK
jgi:starch synthase